MPRYQIRAALSGGFGGLRNASWENSDAETFDDAQEEAFQMSCDIYESYVGSNGLRDTREIMETEGVDEETALEIFYEERESWLTYEAREVTPDQITSKD